MNRKLNHNLQASDAYILYSKPWRETSIIVQIFSRDYGRISMIAKGAKQPYSQLRPILSTFQPLIISWSGKNDIKILTRAELNGIRFLSGSSLMPAWYMNELIIRMLPFEDSCPKLFDAYDIALRKLSSKNNMINKNILHFFEWVLLRETGYGTDLLEEPNFFDSSKLRLEALKSINKRLKLNLNNRELKTPKLFNELKILQQSISIRSKQTR
ncbi:MAG: DNA repair protein RecO [Bordetella sp.]|nr:MAG: DNA repair protein RecO [Bordetella sp.]